MIEEMNTIYALKCQQKCELRRECVAFSYTPGDTDNNCVLYEGGPYTHGDRDAKSICYIMTKGSTAY